MRKLDILEGKDGATIHFINDMARRFHLEQSVQGSKVVLLEAEISRQLGQTVYVTFEAYRILLNMMKPDDKRTHLAVEFDPGAAAFLAEKIWTADDVICHFQGAV